MLAAQTSSTAFPSRLPFKSVRKDFKRSFLLARSTQPSSLAAAAATTTTVPAAPLLAVQTPGLTRVDILSESLPFIQRFRGKTVVVKCGGPAMKSAALRSSVINDLVLLSCVGLRPVLVHGGGPEINSWLLRLGHEPQFHNGLKSHRRPHHGGR
ncbi:unnamed protein product [Musa acuminata subsp. burmannicoides]